MVVICIDDSSSIMQLAVTLLGELFGGAEEEEDGSSSPVATYSSYDMDIDQ